MKITIDRTKCDGYAKCVQASPKVFRLDAKMIAEVIDPKADTDEQEYALYEQVYARLAIDAPAPDLIVYLQAPVDVLLDRIARRGIAYEQQIERRYLERLNDAYARFFLEFDAAPLLIVNAADIDPLGSEADYEGLLAEVVRPRKGRHYFNPLKSLL